MKPFQIILILSLCIHCLAKGQEADSVKYFALSPYDFERLCLVEQNGFFADVREKSEYRKFRIKDFINIPASGNIDITIDSVDKNRPVFLYCETNSRSVWVAKRFVDKGFSQVYYLDGGINEWKKDNYPIDKKRIWKKKKT